MNTLKISACSFNRKQKTIIKDLSLSLNSNTITAILGPNGTGKSTLFKIIIGAINADSGTIHLNSKPITKMSLSARVASGIMYLPQKSSIFLKMSVKENLIAAAENLNKTSNLGKIVSDFKLAAILEQKAYSLSGGQRRTVELARCMMLKPKFLLLDEPFAGIDPKTIEHIKTLLKNIKQSGVGLVITDHQAEKTINLADITYIINDGRIVANGSASEILNNKKVREIYLG